MKRCLAEKIRAVEIPKQIGGARAGKILSVDENGQVFVDFPGNMQGPITARLTNSMTFEILSQAYSADQEVLLVFEHNDPERPIIVDTLYSSVEDMRKSSIIPMESESVDHITVDGKRVTFDAKEEIVLRCGKASITLTRAGKVLIRGAYLLNRSSGVNRINGGSVQIN
ncbi:MAG: hypothetical protein JRE64_11780 [Deltaproteobacteria bacterium]|nr:hypothetical protein [Deltaproteobacteria bacterium]